MPYFKASLSVGNFELKLGLYAVNIVDANEKLKVNVKSKIDEDYNHFGMTWLSRAIFTYFKDEIIDLAQKEEFSKKFLGKNLKMCLENFMSENHANSAESKEYLLALAIKVFNSDELILRIIQDKNEDRYSFTEVKEFIEVVYSD